MKPRLAVAMASVLIAGLGLVATFGPEERIAFSFYDDAYYYLGVARHLAAGDGSRFDGIHATNGYHPLWCWLLVPVVRVASNPGSGVRAAAALWFALAACVPWGIWWALRRRIGEHAAAIAAVLAATSPWVGLSLARPNGLETPLLALVIAAVVGTADRVLGGPSLPHRGASLGLGALCGIAILARLDAGFLAASVAIAAFRRAKTGALLVVLGAAIVAGPSLAWNQARFGHPLPVSGRVLALEAERVRASHGGALTAGNLAERARIAAWDLPKLVAERAVHGLPAGPVFAVALLALVAAGLAALRGRTSAPGDPLAVLALFAVLHGMAYALWLWTPGEELYRTYYFLPQILLAATLAAIALARRLGTVTGAVGLAFLATHLVVQSQRYRSAWPAEAGPVASRHIYGWIRERLPEGAVLGARDAGKLGWFTGHPVVNLDGLINDARFLEALRADTVDRYVCDSRIRYLFFDRPYVGRFDPREPARPIADPMGLEGTLSRLGASGSCRLEDAGPATDDWVVLEVLRGP